MNQAKNSKVFSRRALVGGLALMACTQPAWAILGHWRRVARRTTVVVASTAGAEAATSEQQQAAAANSAKASADASAAAAQQAEAQDKAAAAPAKKSPQEQLNELQSLYDQKLISQSDYEAAKTKVLNDMTK